MKNILFFVLALGGGILGSYFYAHQDVVFNLGATTARTTITNPWTFTATTTMNGNLTVTTTNAATSTVSAGCYEFTATSTATWQKFQASTTPGVMYSQYGRCPRI